MNERHKQVNVLCIRLLTIVLCVLLCSIFFSLPAFAETGDGASSPSVDAVILMDHSKSMDDNDGSSYRIDAVQMFISMCDMKSRVAFVPFARSIIDTADTDFTDISNDVLRRFKLTDMDKYRETADIYDTDFGQALNYAVKLLTDRKDTTNHPMIILLTDGNNYFNKRSNVTVTVWDEVTKSFKEEKYRNYTTVDANMLCRFAALGAKENDIPIYTFAIPNIKYSAEEQYALEQLLEEISVSTGVGDTFTRLSADTVADLPLYFGDILAGKIGSDLIGNLVPSPVTGKQGTYRISLPVFNSSVYEMNIYIPTDTIDAASIHLVSPNGEGLSGGGDGVVLFESKAFRLYKIIQPRERGKWTLEFSVDQTTALPEDVKFGILYSYDMTLKTQLGRKPEDMQSTGTGITLGKGDILYLNASFYNAQDERVNDPRLFENKSGAALDGIRCTYELCDSYGSNVICHGVLSGSFDSFSGSLDLSEIDPDDDGYNQLSAGNYILRIIADGAGLHRENELDITLTNNAPEMIGNDTGILRYQYIVDDPFSASPGVNQPLEIALDSKFLDPDHDKLLFTNIAPVDDADQYLNLTLDSGVIRGTAIADNDNGLSTDRELEYTFLVSDGDVANKPYRIIVEMTSVAQNILNAYRCDTEISGYDPESMTVAKGQPISVTMNLRNNGAGAWDTADVVRLLDGKLMIYNAVNTEEPLETLPMKHNGTGQLTCTYTPSGSSQPLVMQCVYTLADFPNASMTSDPVAIRVLNHLVQSDAAAVAAIQTDISFIPEGVTLWTDQAATPSEDLVISLDTLFSDADASDTLTYSYIPLTDPLSPLGVQLNSQNNTLTLTPQHSGTFQLTIMATDRDSDGNIEAIPLQFTVTDIAETLYLRYKCITEATGYDKKTQSAAKDTDITFSLYLYDTVTQNRDTSNAIRNFTSCEILIYASDHMETPIQTLYLTKNNQYTATYRTPNKAAELVIKYRYTFTDTRLAPIADTLVNLQVTNAPPEMADGALDKIPTEIRFIPGQIAMWTPSDPTPESDLRIQLKKLFTDSDAGDTLTFTCTQTDDSSPVSAVIDPATGILTLAAQHKGNFTLTITAEDSDPNTQAKQITQSITVVDLAEEVFQMFEYKTETNGSIQSSATVKKDTDITFKLSLWNSDSGLKDTSEAIRNFKGELLVYHADDLNTVLQTIPINSTTGYSGTYHTPCSSAELVVRYQYTFADSRKGLLTGTVTNVNVMNQDPEIVQSVLNMIPITVGYIPESTMLWIPEPATPDKLLKISLASLFRDADACDTLRYTVTTVGKSDAMNVQFNEDTNIVTLVPISDGIVTIRLTATDSDPLAPTKIQTDRTIFVRDLAAKWRTNWLLMLLGLAVLLILTFIIWQALKPRYPKHARFFVFDGGAIIESEIVHLKKTKKKYKLVKLLDATIAQRNGISADILSAIHIKPSHRKDGIKVHCTISSAGACSVRMGDKRLTKRYTTWKMGDNLFIESAASKKQMRILLTHDDDHHIEAELVDIGNPPDNPADEEDNIGGLDLPDEPNHWA